MFEVLGGVGLLLTIVWYLKGRLDTMQNNHLQHVQESLDSIEKKLDNFIQDHLKLHISEKK